MHTMTMTQTQIIDALIPAHLMVSFGKPMTADEKAEAAKALAAVRTLSGPERVAIHEATKAAANLCAGEAA
jgi:hypothetical protein